MKEFIERRRLQRFVVYDPDCPLDEATPEDYIKRRNGDAILTPSDFEEER